jgi:hypothetical protein
MATMSSSSVKPAADEDGTRVEERDATAVLYENDDT